MLKKSKEMLYLKGINVHYLHLPPFPAALRPESKTGTDFNKLQQQKENRHSVRANIKIKHTDYFCTGTASSLQGCIIWSKETKAFIMFPKNYILLYYNF